MSQIVGAQATLNTIAGERYAAVSQEVKHYLRGAYGKIPGKVNAAVRAKILGNQTGAVKKPAVGNEMEKLTAELEGLAHNETDLLTYALFPEIGKTFLQERAAGKLQPLQLQPLPDKTGGDGDDDGMGKEAEYRITIHGETYAIRLTGIGGKDSKQRSLFFTVDGVSEEALIEGVGASVVAGDSRSGNIAGDETRPPANAPGDVTTTMPGSIVSVLVEEGQTVKTGAALQWKTKSCRPSTVKSVPYSSARAMPSNPVSC